VKKKKEIKKKNYKRSESLDYDLLYWLNYPDNIKAISKKDTFKVFAKSSADSLWEHRIDIMDFLYGDDYRYKSNDKD